MNNIKSFDEFSMNEMFGFGKPNLDFCYDYTDKLKKLKIESNDLVKYSDKAIDSLNELNKILDEISKDKKIMKIITDNKFDKLIDKLIKNVCANEYGINRSKDNFSADSNTIYLGGIHGLFTKPLKFWLGKTDDKESIEHITKQFFDWINDNINALIKIFNDIIKIYKK